MPKEMRSMRLEKMYLQTIGILLGMIMFGAGSVAAEPFWSTLDPSTIKKSIPLTNDTVANLVQKLKPAVVNISVTQMVTSGTSQEFHAPFGGDEQFREFWKRFFGNQEPKEFKKKGLGSGFVISKDGYIVTNNHVVQKAKDITVVLSTKEQYPAKIIGTDPKIDIALIKVEPKRELTIIPLGNSDTLREGESVIAIGNPFGLSETVTAGIVSAKGRTIGAGPYDDFIQTDASINPGNSGGPLINYHGEVVGINTAIVSAAQGIGFAVPINMVKEILIALKEKGKVTRGWLGVSIQEVTPEIARSFGLKDEKGALVSDVVAGGPAEKAGIRRGDIITEFNGKVVKDYHDLPRIVASISPGERVTFTVLRDGKEEKVSAVIGELRESEPEQPEEVQKLLGISLQAVTPEIAKELGMKKTEGIVVTSVEPDSLASESKIERGDVILEVDRKPVNSLKDFNDAVGKVGDSLLLLIYRNGSTFYVSMKISR